MSIVIAFGRQTTAKNTSRTWLCMHNHTIARPVKQTKEVHEAWQCLRTAIYNSSGTSPRQRPLSLACSALARRFSNALHLLSTLKPNKRHTGGRKKHKNLRDEIMDTAADVLLSFRSSARDMPRTQEGMGTHLSDYVAIRSHFRLLPVEN